MPSTCYLRRGDKFFPETEANLNMVKQLPIGTYSLQFNPMAGGFYFEVAEGFKLPKRIYGSTQRHAERVLRTFDSRENSTGVLLSGEKGTGKTLLTKVISEFGLQRKMPTIIVSQEFSGDGFNKVIQNLEQPAIIMFDEFEKVYGKENQQQLLTLLDGLYNSKKLFLLTCNDLIKVDMHMQNRPGRIFYALEFRGLETSFIREYCEDNLEDKKHINLICQIASLFYAFSFDLLVAIVEEMNRYKEDPLSALELLNAKPDLNRHQDYEFELICGDKVFKNTKKNEDLIYCSIRSNQNPLTVPEFTVTMGLSQSETPPDLFKLFDQDGNIRRLLAEQAEETKGNMKERKKQVALAEAKALKKKLKDVQQAFGLSKEEESQIDPYWEWQFKFHLSDMKDMDVERGAIVFKNEQGAVVQFMKKKVEAFHYSMLGGYDRD